MIALAGFAESSVGFRHALGYAEVLKERCLAKRESATQVAASLGLDPEQTKGAIRLLDRHPRLSPERLATVVMRDWGMTNADVAEIFGRSERWARVVREQADEIRAEEPVDGDLEYLDAGLQPSDPSPDEILLPALEVRKARPGPSPAMACYQWSAHAFVPVIPG